MGWNPWLEEEQEEEEEAQDALGSTIIGGRRAPGAIGELVRGPKGHDDGDVILPLVVHLKRGDELLGRADIHSATKPPHQYALYVLTDFCPGNVPTAFSTHPLGLRGMTDRLAVNLGAEFPH